MRTLPTVAIVGRPNVGKSALFNRLVGRRIAIVHDQPGVTRDRLAAPCVMTEIPCEVVDTGGIGAALDDGFADQVTTEADIAMETANLIMFVVDCREDITLIDQRIAARLHKGNIPVMLVLNKADHVKQDASVGTFASLGFGAGVTVSAEHGRGFHELTSKMDELLEPFAPHPEDEEETAPIEYDENGDPIITESTKQEDIPLKVAVVGRPNAGKSSLINAMLNDRRTIVSDVAGTTRDAIDIPYTHNGKPYLLIDTAGMRPRSRRDTSVEVFSAMRSEKAIRRSDICLLVIDIDAGVTQQDRRIASMIAEEKKPCIIVVNKFDLYHPDAAPKARKEAVEEHIRRELFFIDYAPFVALSALHGEGIPLVFKVLEKIRRISGEPLGTGQLNRFLQKAMDLNPPGIHKSYGRRLKLLYATKAVNEKYTAIPVPTYILFVNDKRLMTDSYEQYLRNRLRDFYPCPAIPITFSVRSRSRKDVES